MTVQVNGPDDDERFGVVWLHTRKLQWFVEWYETLEDAEKAAAEFVEAHNTFSYTVVEARSVVSPSQRAEP